MLPRLGGRIDRSATSPSGMERSCMASQKLHTNRYGFHVRRCIAGHALRILTGSSRL